MAANKGGDVSLGNVIHNLSAASLPEGFSLCNPVLGNFVDHINKCYGEICISEAELMDYTRIIEGGDLADMLFRNCSLG